MEYCNLGHSGLEVSRLALGAIPFGTWMTDKESRDMADIYLDAGGNFLDTSNIYGGGLSELSVGRVIRGRRDRFVVGSKGAWLVEKPMRPNAFGLSRAYLTANIEDSLKRLGTDYIDLYQCHVQDPYTPIEETMRVLDDFVRAGKIRYVGVSNWGGWQVVKANMHARQSGLTPAYLKPDLVHAGRPRRRVRHHPRLPRSERLHHRLGRARPGLSDRPLPPRGRGTAPRITHRP